MPSAVGGDLSKIQTGPCHVTYSAVDVGHTMEGVRVNNTQDLRERKVDEYGMNLADLIDQGTDLTSTMTLAEKTMVVLQLVFQWGYQITAVMQGFGKIPGTTGQTIGDELILHPLEVGDVTEDVTFFKAVISETDEIEFGTITQDRVFGVTFRCLIDESKADGQLLGRMGGPAP